MVPPLESRVLVNEVGGLSYSKTPFGASVAVVRTVELIEERLKASSMAIPSSVLTFRASLWMYLVGDSGLRTLNRGNMGLAAVFAIGRPEGGVER